MGVQGHTALVPIRPTRISFYVVLQSVFSERGKFSDKGGVSCSSCFVLRFATNRCD
jgi:hypothetical protein